MSTETFYSDLPALEKFLDITNFRNYVSVPPDWHILVTDVIGSTKAIETGRYKEVNLIGAASIVANLNIAGNLDLPYVFGGDGASILIPPSLLPKAKQALLATQDLAKKEFALDLRVGVVPVAVVKARRYDVKLAKLKVSQNYNQAVFTGYGLTDATELVKNQSFADIYQLKNPGDSSEADFSGLECRWQDIPSKHGETVSLLVMATAVSFEEANLVYKQVLEQIQEIYGDEADFHPISAENLNLAFKESDLIPQFKIRSKSGNWIDRQMYLSKVKLELSLGGFFRKLKMKKGNMDWVNFKNSLIDSTDYKKFDDLLRMVMAGNARQRDKLLGYLEKQYKEGKLIYGLHTSDRAIMTCLVFEKNGRQVHFVDGADGGYALAAKAMKDKIKEFNQRYKI